MEKPLKFIVAPHIVQDLGLNLYTSLPRVLVEFVANAYDADSPYAKITLDINAIKSARNQLKDEYTTVQGATSSSGPRVPLTERTLPASVTIEIEDAGHGMSRQELQDKFLVAGRRRRELDSSSHTKGGRLLMGRKGLGKLAGFGVARKVVVETRLLGESHGTRITLDYDEILKAKNTSDIIIPEERCEDGLGFENSGTRIILSYLIYEPMKSRLSTIGKSVAEHFSDISASEFSIQLSGEELRPPEKNLVFAWPNPELGVEELVSKQIETEDGERFEFRYRLRFVDDHHCCPK